MMPQNLSVATIKPIEKRIPVVALGLVWLGLVTTAILMMIRYSQTPGLPSAPAANWPAASRLPRDHDRPTLVLFVHPRCPCSRATIGELERLMAHCQGRVNAHIFFLQPAGMTAKWTETDTWRAAELIPGVTVHRDEAGREARLFGAVTSGDTALYDAQGRLAFHGGITDARGHAGDNTGEDALQALIFGATPQSTSAPTYGCSLFECTPADNQSK
jgi:hypothetical protein